MPKIKISRDIKLEGLFRDWLSQRPADATFNANSSEQCAFAQFLSETGMATEPNVRSLWWFDNSTGEKNGKRIPTPIVAAFKAPLRASIVAFSTALEQFDKMVVELEAL